MWTCSCVYFFFVTLSSLSLFLCHFSCNLWVILTTDNLSWMFFWFFFLQKLHSASSFCVISPWKVSYVLSVAFLLHLAKLIPIDPWSVSLLGSCSKSPWQFFSYFSNQKLHKAHYSTIYFSFIICWPFVHSFYFKLRQKLLIFLFLLSLLHSGVLPDRLVSLSVVCLICLFMCSTQPACFLHLVFTPVQELMFSGLVSVDVETVRLDRTLPGSCQSFVS